MKKILLFLLMQLFLLNQNSFSQSYIDTLSCLTNSTFSRFAFIDSSYQLCNSTPSSNFNIHLDTNSTNIWQFGKTIKFGSSSSQDTTCGIITDTVNTYPTNNLSSFYFYLPNNKWSELYNYYISFWHRFETDTLKDGCWIEFSSDSGQTWYLADSAFNSFPFYYKPCNFYFNTITNKFDTIVNNIPAWGGSSNGWKYTSMSFNNVFPLKPTRNSFINALKFVFKSDSINTNKAGWFINNINIGYLDLGSSMKEFSKNKLLNIYPNPSSNGNFYFSDLDNNEDFLIEVFDISGRKILETRTNHIDLSLFNKGLYYYKTFYKKINYSGKIINQ